MSVNEIVTLKAHLYDVKEALSSSEAQRAQFVEALSAIAQLVGVGVDGEEVQLKAIVDAVQALLPVQEELPLE